MKIITTGTSRIDTANNKWLLVAKQLIVQEITKQHKSKMSFES